ncbi:9963_t:CDS:2 [Cetraspora pellucida]|uniref:9963_t:CDS:1 n=1 Tax=Cetraspora pellucida TaxID=1433469 RepID=A0A9N9F8R6_9GLOM|nr:9963_t:CDS:2 [Cetraspora pellucida]
MTVNFEAPSSNTFNKFTYEKEELDKIDGYYMVESFEDKINLYSNLWKYKIRPVIYLTLVENMLIQKKKKPKLMIIEQLKKFT